MYNHLGKFEFIPYRCFINKVRLEPKFVPDLVNEWKIFHELLEQKHHICVFHALNMYMGCIYFQAYWQCVRVVARNAKKGLQAIDKSRGPQGLPISCLKHGLVDVDHPVEVVTHEEVVVDGTEATYPHIVLERLGIRNAIIAIDFDYLVNGVRYKYGHCINLKRNMMREDKWAICDSSLKIPHYIEAENPREAIDIKYFYGLMKRYSVHTLEHKKYESEEEKQKDVDLARRLMTVQHKDWLSGAGKRGGARKKSRGFTNSKAAKAMAKYMETK